MPVDPRYNRTNYTPVWPSQVIDPTNYLKRETTTTPDELKDQARALNVLFLELQRLQEVLGTIPGWTLGDLFGSAASGSAFGDGNDGDVTVAGTTNLTRDMYYNNLTVTGTLNTTGYRVFVRETLTVGPGAFISCNGANAVGAVQGSGAANGSLGGGKDGGAGGANNGTATTNSLGAAGGDGGGAGGTGGTYAATTTGIRDLARATTLVNHTGRIDGGAGGGGGEDTGGGGAGGGGGGGVIMIAAHDIVNEGTIRANGGNGANGGADGGGGGGGGGAVVIVTTTPILGGGSITASAGSGGTGVAGAGVNGSAGQTFTVIL